MLLNARALEWVTWNGTDSYILVPVQGRGRVAECARAAETDEGAMLSALVRLSLTCPVTAALRCELREASESFYRSCFICATRVTGIIVASVNRNIGGTMLKLLVTRGTSVSHRK
ncbi:hypothetical protein NDU88_003696 [Pleurodeles waltl]|uniref:Uncharacterized protein n=1 Tax=Pleurodeles waltl TaxID=8319 RepID=A0AAV7SGM9_PLEWA|nr:hypothetical protein NDU88_003696 [Pleurodeles waltl]